MIVNRGHVTVNRGHVFVRELLEDVRILLIRSANLSTLQDVGKPTLKWKLGNGKVETTEYNI